MIRYLIERCSAKYKVVRFLQKPLEKSGAVTPRSKKHKIIWFHCYIQFRIDSPAINAKYIIYKS